MNQRKALGQGLSILLKDRSQDMISIKIFKISANKLQPRQNFEHIDELMESIKKRGVLHPLLVRKISEDKFELIAGERRLRAAQELKMEQVPCKILDVTDRESLEIAILENVQRSDLQPIDEALGYKKLIEEFGYTQEQISSSVGKSRSHVANLIRLLKLPEEVKSLINRETISVGHGKVILQSENPSEIAEKVVKEKLNVRQTEKIVKMQNVENELKEDQSDHNENFVKNYDLTKNSESKNKNEDCEKNPEIDRLQQYITDLTKMRILVNDNSGKGNLQIFYNSFDELDYLVEKINNGFR